MKLVDMHNNFKQVTKIPQGYISIPEFSKKAGHAPKTVGQRITGGKVPYDVLATLRRPGKKTQVIIRSDYLEIYIANGRTTKPGPPQKTVKNESQIVAARQKRAVEEYDPPGIELKDIHHWKLKTEKAKAEKLALELQIAKNKVIPVENEIEFLKSVMLVVRQGMLALPPRLIPDLVGQTDPVKMKGIMESRIRKVLNEMTVIDKHISLLEKNAKRKEKKIE